MYLLTILNMRKLIHAVILALMVVANINAQPEVATKNSDGDFALRNKSVTLSVIMPGGRIVSFRHGNSEIITQRSEHVNFGSTLWLGPQSNWGWPPYKILDEEKYQALFSTDSIYLKSQPDTLSGFQLTKSIRPDKKANCFVVTYTLRNISGTTRQTDAWEVTRVPAGGLSFFPEGEKAKLPGSDLQNTTSIQGYTWFCCGLDKFEGGQKLYASASGGWLAHVHQNLLFIKQFPDILPDQLAPQQGEVEIYAHGDRTYIELENHSQYVTLAPGESLKYQVKWYLVTLPASIKAEAGNPELIKCVTQILKKGKL